MYIYIYIYIYIELLNCQNFLEYFIFRERKYELKSRLRGGESGHFSKSLQSKSSLFFYFYGITKNDKRTVPVLVEATFFFI